MSGPSHRTAGNKSPFQLWIQGMLSTPDQGINYTNTTDEVLGEMSLQCSSTASVSVVELEDPPVPINDDQLLVLNSTLDPFHYSVQEWDEVYLAVRQFLTTCNYF